MIITRQTGINCSHFQWANNLFPSATLSIQNEIHYLNIRDLKTPSKIYTLFSDMYITKIIPQQLNSWSMELLKNVAVLIFFTNIPTVKNPLHMLWKIVWGFSWFTPLSNSSARINGRKLTWASQPLQCILQRTFGGVHQIQQLRSHILHIIAGGMVEHHLGKIWLYTVFRTPRMTVIHILQFNRPVSVALSGQNSKTRFNSNNKTEKGKSWLHQHRHLFKLKLTKLK